MSTEAAQAVAVLRGIADDYARSLREHGYATMAGMVTGVAKEASDSLVLHLRSERPKKPPIAENEPQPHEAPTAIHRAIL